MDLNCKFYFKNLINARKIAPIMSRYFYMDTFKFKMLPNFLNEMPCNISTSTQNSNNNYRNQRYKFS